MPFSWKQAIDRVPIDLLKRYKCMARANPDFQVQHPELVKELMNNNIQNKVETLKFIKRKCDKTKKYGDVPKPSVVIKRYNRVV